MKTRFLRVTETRTRLLVLLTLLCVQAFSGSSSARELNIEAPGPQGPLKGSFLEAAPSVAPVVLIIPGS